MSVATFPAELRALARWVSWRAETVAGRPAPSKVPYGRDAHRASSTNPATWLSCDAAQSLAALHNMAGVGFVLNGDSQFTVLDLDACFDVCGEPLPWAAALLAQLPATYVERSPSGLGLHIWLRASKRDPRCRFALDGGRFECYDRARFVCVTGERWNGAPMAIANGQTALDALLPTLGTRPAASPPHQRPDTWGGTDAALLRRARRARNGAKFCKLYDEGDYRAFGYASQSEADLALCRLLAWYTHDAEQIDRLFRQSKLYRSKWDRLSAPTIARVLAQR